MARIDVEKLLRPISDAEPCGPNLEYDAAFTELERAGQGTPEQQYGDTIIPAVEPEWNVVFKDAIELLERTKDLRVTIHLVRAALRGEGLAEFCDALVLLSGLVQQNWPTIHPQLDPDDDNDPTLRVNSIAGLVDVPSVLTPLRLTPLVRSRTVGAFNRRDIAIAFGEIAAPPQREGEEQRLPERSMVEGAFQSCDHAVLLRFRDAAQAGAKAVRELETFVTREVGSSEMRTLAPLTKELDGIYKLLAEQYKRVAGSEPSAEPEAQAAEAEEATDGASGSAAGVTRVVVAKRAGLVQDWNAELQSRDEATRLLEKICQYYEKHEPSSPLPLLLRRALRLSSKNFLEILFDVSPDGLGQAEALGGMTREEYLQMISGQQS